MGWRRGRIWGLAVAMMMTCRFMADDDEEEEEQFEESSSNEGDEDDKKGKEEEEGEAREGVPHQRCI